MAKAIRYFIGNVERETAKAILVKFCVFADTVYDGNGDAHAVSKYATTRLPKSQIEVYHQLTSGDEATIWKVPLWLCNKNGLPITTKAIADEIIGRMS